MAPKTIDTISNMTTPSALCSMFCALCPMLLCSSRFQVLDHPAQLFSPEASRLPRKDTLGVIILCLLRIIQPARIKVPQCFKGPGIRFDLARPDPFRNRLFVSAISLYNHPRRKRRFGSLGW